MDERKGTVKRCLLTLAVVSVFVLVASPAWPAVTRVKRVIDGDTILLANGEKVRYIGIDTPEINHSTKGAEPFGLEAKEANEQLVEGKRVRLEFDVERRDRYGRLLAYVFLEDGTFVNGWLVEHGLARARAYPPNVRYQDLLERLEWQAQEKRLGLWAGAPSPFERLGRLAFPFLLAATLATLFFYLYLLRVGRRRREHRDERQ